MKKSTFLLCLSTAAITLSVFMLTVTSCRKGKDDNNTTTTAEDKLSASDNALADQTFDDAQNNADKAMNVSNGGSMGLKTTAGCSATVTHSTDTTIIDFGPVNCTGAGGRTRRGKIIVVHTGGHYADSGHSHTITFDNFYLNDNKITGYKTVTNMGHNSAGQPYFNITVNGTITRTTGATIAQNSTRVRTWTAGYSTTGSVAALADDVYSITGTGTLVRTSATGTVTTLNVNTTSPLIVATACQWIQAGTISFTSGTGATRTLNYGTTPVCDDQATLTLASGAVHTITLP
jgi:hypothetical protein